MAQLTVQDVDSELVQRLRSRAARNSRSPEAEHRAILESVLRPSQPGFWQRAAELRKATEGRPVTDSAILIREDRDRDHKPGHS